MGNLFVVSFLVLVVMNILLWALVLCRDRKSSRQTMSLFNVLCVHFGVRIVKRMQPPEKYIVEKVVKKGGRK